MSLAARTDSSTTHSSPSCAVLSTRPVNRSGIPGTAGAPSLGRLDAWSPWWFVLYLGLVPGVVGHGLLNWSVRRLPVHVVSLLVLLEPVGAGALAWLLLDEVPTVHEGVGAVVLLVGIGSSLGARERPD